VGERRINFDAGQLTPNMLQSAVIACTKVLPSDGADDFRGFFNRGAVLWNPYQGLISKNGDAALWERLCNVDNQPVIRVITNQSDKLTKTLNKFDLYWGTPESYPATADVMNQRGEIVKGVGVVKDLAVDNTMPLCMRKPGCMLSSPPTCAPDNKTVLSQAEPEGPAGQLIPWCPDQLFALGADGKEKFKFAYHDVEGGGGQVFDDMNRWAIRGAANAGLAVFLYLKDLESCKVMPTPAYNQCDKIGKATCQKN
jgi:hypothetical protein